MVPIGPQVDLRVRAGEHVHEDLALVPVPDYVYLDAPRLCGFCYVVNDRRAVFVDPLTREVVQVEDLR